MKSSGSYVLSICQWMPQGTSRCLKLVLVICFLSVCLFFMYFRPGEHFHLRSKSSFNFSWWRRILRTSSPSVPKPKILVWTGYFGRENWLPSPKDIGCPVDNCDITYDHSLADKSSALLLHLRDVKLDDLPDLPTDRPGPLWVLLNEEAPPNTPADVLRGLKGRIHWTVSYRSDSTIYAPYGAIVKRTEPFAGAALSSNRSLVCWLVSNCETASERESLVKEMGQHIPIKIYGKCGKHKCPEEDKSRCYEWLAERCKFYLSFENSICRDYATEKLFYALANNMVPVVLGRANYSKILPKDSFVDALEFSSPKSLAEFLLKLGYDDERYASYLHWKKYYVPKMLNYAWLCGLCRKLHEADSKDLQLHRDLLSWWFKDSECSSWKEIMRSHL